MDESGHVRAWRSHKVRPLDHLSWEERSAVSYLEKGGFWPEVVRSRRVLRDDAARYQIWLFDHQPGYECAAGGSTPFPLLTPWARPCNTSRRRTL